MKAVILAIATACSVASLADRAVGQTYTFKIQNFDGAQTFPNAVSDRNLVVGLYTYIPGSLTNSYAGYGKHLFAFNYPGASVTLCNGVNKSGTIAGGYRVNNASDGFTYAAGFFTTILPPGAMSASVTTISDNGKLGGLYTDAAGTAHAFIKTQKKYEEFDIPGTFNPNVVGINNSGQYVVQSLVGNYQLHSYLSFAPYFIELNYPGSTNTQGYQINNKGQVALSWEDNSGFHGGVYDLYAEQYYRIDYPGATGTVITGINDDETVVGTYVGPDYPYSGAFIAHGTLR